MGKAPSNAGRSRGLLFVLVLAALILGMGWFFAAGILRERSRATPPDSVTGESRRSTPLKDDGGNQTDSRPR